MRTKSFIGILPSLLLAYFSISYFSNLDVFRPYRLELQFIFIFIGIIYLLTRPKIGNLLKNLVPFYIYIMFLIATLSFTSMFALNAMYSLSRGVISVTILGVTFTVFYIFIHSYSENYKWRMRMSLGFLFSLILLIVGQLFIPDWSAGIGGVRLSGGTNPNLVAFFTFFIVFMSHYNALIDGKWTKIQQVNWLLGSVVLIWSMSRSNILSLFVFYLLYTLYMIFKDDISHIIRGRITLRLLKKILYTTIGLIGMTFTYKYIQNISNYAYIEARFMGDSGFTSRQYVWDILMEYFLNNPLFGGVGWYNASNILTNSGGTTSPHNLYIRLLSETGLIGAFMVIVLPLILLFGLFIKTTYQNINMIEEKKLILIFTFIIALLTGQLFEDMYLVGIASLSNSIFIWTFALALYLIKKPTQGSTLTYGIEKQQKPA